MDMRLLTGVAAATLTTTASAALVPPQINEFEPNPAGADPGTVPVELIGTPGAPFSGWILGIESDGFNGLVDRAAPVSGTFDTVTGLLVVDVPDFENPSFTIVLTDDFTGDTSTDIDPTNTGTGLDLSALGTIFDAIGLPDAAGDVGTQYGALLGGTDFGFDGGDRELVFREFLTGELVAVMDLDDPADGIFGADGTEYFASDFTADPAAPTFGGANPAFIPEPATAALIGLGALTMLRRRLT